MISLRSVVSSALAAFAALTLAGCGNDATSPLRSLRPASAHLDGKVGNVGNAAKDGDIDVTVLLDNSRNATIEIHTGIFDDLTATPHPNGYFQSIQYKVYNAAGKQVLVRNVNFKKTTPNAFSEPIPFCGEMDSDDDAATFNDQCAVKFLDGWTVSVQANLKDVVGDDKKTDVVREDGFVMWSPDVDMTHQAVTLLDGTTPGSVAPNVLTKFRILIPNNKAGASQLGVTATCVVFIDNVPQIPGVTNGFSYLTGPVLNVPWNGNGDCQFQAKLTPGAHTIYAVAAPIFPDDYDYTNNKSATISVSAIADAPDVATGVFWVNGSAPAPGATVGTGTVVNLAQWVQLLSGTPPGTVTCTATITPAAGVSPSTITGTASLTTNGASDKCALPVTFSAAGTYTVTTVVTLPNGVLDKNTLNNTATNTVVVVPAPMASVALSPINYSDPKLNLVLGLQPNDITGELGSVAGEDSVHNTDVATFSAPLTYSIQNFTGSITVNCTATINGVAATAANFPGLVWAAQTITLPTTGTPACRFSLPFNGSNFASTTGNPYTVVFNITTTGLPNSAPAASQTVSGALTEFVRADISADPFQVTINNVTTPLTGTGVKQSSNVAIQTVVHNPSNVAASVDCGQLYVNIVPPSGFTIPTGANQDSIPSGLTPVKVNATASVPAGGTGTCKYTLTAPQNLGLVSIELIQMVTTTAGNNPKDPNPLNNPATGTFTIVSNGTFTLLPHFGDAPDDISAVQEWIAPTSTAATGGLNAAFTTLADGSVIDKQIFNAKNLALLVIPTAAVLGDFELSDTVYVGTTRVGVANVARAQLGTTTSGITCISTPQNTPLAQSVQPSLVYRADICSRPSLTQAGFHQVVLDVVESLSGQVPFAPGVVVFNPDITMKFVLRFRLVNSTIDDQVTATLNIPVRFLSNECLSALGGGLRCSSSWGAYTALTPISP